MTKEKQLELISEFFAARKNTMLMKGEDYATQEDVLSNFKYSGNIIGLKPEMQILSLIATKVARLGNLLNGNSPSSKPNYESVEDSILDLGCYTDLLYCSLKEKQVERKAEQKGILQSMMEEDEKDGLYNEEAKLSTDLSDYDLLENYQKNQSVYKYKVGDKFSFIWSEQYREIVSISDNLIRYKLLDFENTIDRKTFESEIKSRKIIFI